LFDLTALRMQLAHVQGNQGEFEQARKRIVEIARMLEEKDAVPAVAAQLEYLTRIQQTEFWAGITLGMLEEMRKRLRCLAQFIDRKKRKIVYTDFQDEVTGVRTNEVITMPSMTGAQYEKKVKDYLTSHLNNIVIHRLRTNQPLTKSDLEGLEQTLVSIGEDDGPSLLGGLLARSESPSLAHFVRRMVGMDRTTALAAFSEFLTDRSLTPPQIRFVELIIDQLTARGIVEASALYEPPFSNLHAGGPDELFAGKKQVVDGLFRTLESIQDRVHFAAG